MAFEFFDDIVVVSLRNRLDRRIMIMDQMVKYGFDFRFFNAVYDDNGVKGLVESMKLLFKECLDKKLDNVLILEDDAKFLVDNPKQFFKEVLPQVPDKYLCFYLGMNLLSPPLRMSANILKIQDCYSTHAICYSKEGMEWCLEFLNSQPLAPFDQFMRNWIVPMNRSYCTFPLMVTQRPGFSSIENCFKDWGALMTTTYAMMTKKI